MWVIFEGLDKTGKTTLEYAFLKATNYKHIVIDRGPVGYMTFDEIFGRETLQRRDTFILQATEVMHFSKDFVVVYCFADKDVVDERLKEHNEVCPYDYENAKEKYYRNVKRFYEPKRVLEIDTSKRTIDECVQMIIEKLEEVQRNEL